MSLANVISPPVYNESLTLTAGTNCTITENNSTKIGSIAVIELVVSVTSAINAHAIIAKISNELADSGKILTASGVDGYCYTVTNQENIKVSKACGAGTTLVVWGVVTLK